jgi:hypothetical protein
MSRARGALCRACLALAAALAALLLLPLPLPRAPVPVPSSRSAPTSARTPAVPRLRPDDVFIAVKTTRKNHGPRLRLLLRTWISRARRQVRAPPRCPAPFQASGPGPPHLSTHLGPAGAPGASQAVFPCRHSSSPTETTLSSSCRQVRVGIGWMRPGHRSCVHLSEVQRPVMERSSLGSLCQAQGPAALNSTRTLFSPSTASSVSSLPAKLLFPGPLASATSPEDDRAGNCPFQVWSCFHLWNCSGSHLLQSLVVRSEG